jgi:fatty-acid peroxygenase
LAGRLALLSSEAWLSGLIKQVRQGKSKVDPQSVLYAIAHYHDFSGQQMPVNVCSVEVINVLRPTVAIAQLVTQYAMVLRQFQALRMEVGRDKDATERFALEVRRFYQFFPFLTVKVRRDFVWNGYLFKQG